MVGGARNSAPSTLCLKRKEMPLVTSPVRPRRRPVSDSSADRPELRRKTRLLAALPALLLSLFLGAAPLSATPLSAGPGVSDSDPEAGSITGRVTNADLRPLTGAAVMLRETGAGMMTGSTGTFAFRNLAPGRYTVAVTLIGHAPREMEVEVRDGESSAISVVLQTSAIALDGIEISAALEGQARALMDQRLSDNIVSVVSADGIGRFPDLNMADALNRLSGVSLVRFRGEGVEVNIRGAPPEFSGVAINGVAIPTASEGREANLNAFTTDVVGSVEVTKALTPDIDASSIGGRVNIRTRGALTAGERRIQATPAFGYSALGEVGNYNGSISVGEVFGQDRNVGLLLSASRSRIGRQLDNVENGWEWNDESNDFRPTTVATKAYDIVRTRAAYSARLDWVPSGRASFFVSGAHSFLDNEEERHNVSFRMGDARRLAPGSNSVTGVAEEFTVRWNYHDRRTQTTTQSVSAGGTYQLGFGEVDFTGAFSRARSEIPPGRIYAEYRTPNANRISFRYDYSNPDFPTWTPVAAGSHEVLNNGSLVQDPTRFNFYELNSRENLVRDDRFSLSSNLSIPTRVAHLPTTFRLGVKADLAERDRTYRFYRTRNEPDVPGLSSLLGNRTNNNFGRFYFGNRFENHLVRGAEGLARNMELINASSYPSDWVLGEDIYAAYAMQTTDIGRLRMVGGLRMEHTRVSGEGFVTRDNWTTFEEATTGREYTNVFPSLHANFRVNPDLVLRGAVTTGIIRPRISNMRPSGSINEEAAIPTFSGSNPEIRPTRSLGFDVMGEYYVPLGVFSAGVFYKRLRDVVFTVTREGTAQDFFVDQSLEGYRITRAENSDRGEIYGFEVNLDRPLDFLPAPFNGLGVITNYTYTESGADIPFGGERVSLASQAKHSANLAGYFDRGPMNLRLSFNYQSEYLNSLASDPRLHLYISGRGILDFAATYDVRPGMGLFLEATNLTDSLQRRYRGEVGRVDELEQFGRQLMAGVRMSF
jgi:TonB-dependent receptor